MDVHATLLAIRKAHTLAIRAIEIGDSEEALAKLSWVEAELVALTELSLDLGADVKSLALKQREACAAFREGRRDDSLAMIRTVLSALDVLADDIQRGTDAANPAAIEPS